MKFSLIFQNTLQMSAATTCRNIKPNNNIGCVRAHQPKIQTTTEFKTYALYYIVVVVVADVAISNIVVVIVLAFFPIGILNQSAICKHVWYRYTTCYVDTYIRRLTILIALIDCCLRLLKCCSDDLNKIRNTRTCEEKENEH